MAEHTVKAFSEELDAITQEVARMGGLAETAINDALAAVGRRDTELAQSVIQRDPKIDAAQRETDRQKLAAVRARILAEVPGAAVSADQLYREADLAMAELFGGFPLSFYAAYRAAWPLDPGYETRKPLYNLYHVLNHFNLFGGAYLGQARRMIEGLDASLRR